MRTKQTSRLIRRNPIQQCSFTRLLIAKVAIRPRAFRIQVLSFRILLFFSSAYLLNSNTIVVAHAAGDMSGLSATTALDFREMLRKERKLALKGKEGEGLQEKDAVLQQPRYLSKKRSRLDLERDHRVENDKVQRIYYVPNFVSADEGKRLQDAARRGREQEGAVRDGGGRDNEGKQIGPEWKNLYKRRLQIHGGTPHPSGMVEEELPLFLREVCTALVEAGIFSETSPPNHVLLNEYSEGQGIGPHKDGPLYEGRVAILSLGREACLDFWGLLEDAKADCSDADLASPAHERVDEVSADGSSPLQNSSGQCVEELDVAGTSPSRKSRSRRALVSVNCKDCSLLVFEGEAYYDVWHGIASTSPSATSKQKAFDAEEPNGKGVELSNRLRPSHAEIEEDSAEHFAERMGRGDGGESLRENDKFFERGEIPVENYNGADRYSSKRLSFTVRRVARVVSPESVMEHAEARSERERRRLFFARSVTETGIPAAQASKNAR